MVHLDVNVILIQRDAKMDNLKDWALIIFVLPIFVLIFAILYIIMVNAIVIGMFIDWIVCTFKKSMI
jgi:hypothetical protein